LEPVVGAQAHLMKRKRDFLHLWFVILSGWQIYTYDLKIIISVTFLILFWVFHLFYFLHQSRIDDHWSVASKPFPSKTVVTRCCN
jgi:hypothetical protein